MQSAQSDNLKEKIVIPLYEIVVYPDSRTKFTVDQRTGDLLLAGKKDTEPAYAIGLTVKSGTRSSEVTCSGSLTYSLPMTGT
jgi:ATP-dependent Lon protease